MSIDYQTIEFYDKEALSYSSYSSKNDYSFELEKFCKLIVSEGHILDLGCGSGWASDYFINKKFSVTALDASKNLLATIKDKPKLKKIHSDFSQIRFVNEFDGIWASFSLQHIPKHQFSNTLRLLSESIKQKSILYIGIHEGDRVFRDRLGRLYCYFKEDEIKEILSLNNFKIIDFHKKKSKSFTGEKINIMNIFSQKTL